MAGDVRIVTVKMQRRIPLYDKVCPVCNRPFKGHKLAVYDTKECRKKAAWKRNGQKYNAARRKGHGGEGE